MISEERPRPLWIFMEKLHFFRAINIFTNEVTKELISRKFLGVIEFHIIVLFHHTVWIFANFPLNQRFTKELHSKLIWRKNICVAVNFSFFHTVQCDRYILWSHAKRFSVKSTLYIIRNLFWRKNTTKLGKSAKHSVVIPQILSHDFLRQIGFFFVKSKRLTFPLVKMAKMQLQNGNFWQFCAELRRN